MDTRLLETFFWVVRLGGVSATARHMNVTQPAVTRRIQELERELGAKLFTRVKKNVMPTQVGLACLALAEKIMLDVSAMHEAAKGRDLFWQIRIGVAELIALTWLNDLIVRLEEKYPGIRLVIDVDLSSRLLDKINRQQLDIVLVPGSAPLHNATIVDLGSCPMRWLAHPCLMTDRKLLKPHDLISIPIITLPQAGSTHGVMMDWFGKWSMRPQYLHFCNNFSVLATLVRRGVGMALLPYELFIKDIEDGGLLPVIGNEYNVHVKYSAIYIQNDALPFLPEVAKYACEESRFRSGSGGLKQFAAIGNFQLPQF